MGDWWVEEYAGYIRHALESGDPVSVADIVEDIDWSQRMGVSLDEPNGGLSRLIERGEVVQLPDFRFALAPAPPVDRSFTPVPAELLDEVQAERTAFFAPFLHEPDPAAAAPTEPAWPKLRVTATFWSEPSTDGVAVDPDGIGRAMRLFETLEAELVAAGIPRRPAPS